MTNPTITLSATANRPIDVAWNAFVPVALPDVFPKAKGPVPAVVKVTGQTGRWDKVGESRLVHLGDGAIVTEAITLSDPTEGAAPQNGQARFGYRVSGFARPFGLLTSEANGFWTFDEVAGVTRITWRYTFTPTSFLTRPIMALVVRTFWKSYMADGLANVVRIIEET